MCQIDGRPPVAAATEHDDCRSDDFPWHIGVCDAHCHPTDTMSSIASITRMRTRVLTIMATRSQDQDLVASAAAEHGIQNRAAIALPAAQHTPDRVVAAFGWHPWFSHQLYDDTACENPFDPHNAEHKAKHYSSVLTPPPDEAFIAALPDPLPLSLFLTETRRRVLEARTALIGEVGLDKAFRLPWPWNAAEHSSRDQTLTPGGREGRTLSMHHVRMPHQIAVLKAQLRLAGELGVAVSVHGVQAHGVLFDALASLWKGFEKEVVSRRKQKLVAKGAEDFESSEEEEEYGDEGLEETQRIAGKGFKPKPFPPRVCLHSFSGSPQTVQQYRNPSIPLRVYFSFSTVINLSTAGGESKFPDVVRACPDDRVLLESDLHCAGEDMDRVLEDIARKVCEIKGWSLEEGLTRIRKNYEEFIFG
ncbi:Metallo-dependent hydrolase [Parathielavia appendiculata]|uniref:Metallo-dependent hydrolase n=1 Tax=Parathielavia appendiculata TaxID=2587402 RepID=A0AAN6U543_9PEZI|nr:Metallo-dependent hydrolase [Parathielavia appendiculata]